MNFKSLKDQSSIHKSKKELTLENWLEATYNLHMNYDKISTSVYSMITNPSQCEKENMYMGQCSLTSLMELQIKMGGELERLLHSMDQWDTIKQSTPEQFTNQLTDHTLILNELNHQAKIMLELAAHPSS